MTDHPVRPESDRPAPSGRDTQLALLAAKNERLAEALRAAREQIVELKKQIDDLAKPPGTYATYLAGHDDGSVDVISSGRKMHVQASPGLDLDALAPGQEVKLNEAMTVVAAGGYERIGELVTVKEVLDPERVLVVGRADEERVVRLAGSVLGAPLRVGDALTVDMRSGFVFEVVPKSE